VRHRLLAVLLAQVLALAVPAGAAAAACPRTSLADLEDEVMCVVCGTQLGLATEAPQAQRTRQFILGQIDRCRSKDQIKAALVGQFGPEVLADPADEGFSLAAYLVPILAFVGAGGALGWAVVGWRRGRHRRRDGPPAPAVPAPSSADSARLETDLDRYEL